VANEKRRVVVTGVGVIACNGIGKEAFWEAIQSGKTGIDSITSFDASKFTTRFAGEVKDFKPELYVDRKNLRRMDRTSQMSVATAKMAVEDAKIDLHSNGASERTGVVIGTAMAGHHHIMKNYHQYLQTGPDRVSPFVALASFPDACASQVSIELGVKGPSFSIATACSSASDAIGYAWDAIRSNVVDFIIMGGAEAGICEGVLAAFCAARALSTRNHEPKKACRPFNKDRDGFVLGEGAGMLVLEEYEHAKRRGAHIYAEILGHGMTCDAYHMTSPDPEGTQAIRAMQIAMKNAGVTPDEIDYINAHGTSTPLNDKIETMIIKKVFGARAYKIPISATKSMIGHLIGAAGSVELIATLLAMEENMIPPTINYEIPDPECDLDYVPNKARSVKIRTAMKNSFGFGGKNSILVIRKVEE